MIKSIITYISKQTLQFKILFQFSVLLFFAATGYAIKSSYENYLLVKTFKNQKKAAEKALIVSSKKTVKITTKAKVKAINISEASKNIDKKLIKDAKDINNDAISDNDMLLFAKDYER